MFSTPSGKPASATNCPSRKAVSGVSSSGFNTTVQPAATAGAIFETTITSGQLHGINWPTTPTGWRSVYDQKVLSGVSENEELIVEPANCTSALKMG